MKMIVKIHDSRRIEDIQCPSCGKFTVKARTYDDGSYQQYCEIVGCWWGKTLPGRVTQHCNVCEKVTEHIIYRDIYGKPYADKCVMCQTNFDIVYY